MAAYSADVLGYLDRTYDQDRQQFACCASDPRAVKAWQHRARPALRTPVGLDTIKASVHARVSHQRINRTTLRRIRPDVPPSSRATRMCAAACMLASEYVG